MKSIYFRHFLLTIALIMFGFVIFGLFFMGMATNYFNTSKQDVLLRNAQSISVTTANLAGRNGAINDYAYRMYTEVMSQQTGAEILLCNADGVVIFSSVGNGSGSIDKSIEPAVVDLIYKNGRASVTGKFGELFNDKRITCAVPVNNNVTGRPIGIVLVSSPISDLTDMHRGFISLFILLGISVLTITMVSGIPLSRFITRPIKNAANAANSFAHGNFDVRLPGEERGDEIGELAKSFNAMATTLEKSEELRRDFIANVSHELKTPMTVIAGYVDGILDKTIPEDRWEEYLRTVSGEVHRLSRFVRRMLEISKMRAGEMGLNVISFDVCEIARRVVLTFENRVDERELSIEVDFERDDMYVDADPDYITQVFYNLMDNAVKFCEEGGTIMIGIVKKAGKALVSVRNDGPEIPPDDLPFIFDRFHKTDRSRAADRDGVGLGLYIVQSIINSHNESIKVESAGHQTRFTFTLPLS